MAVPPCFLPPAPRTSFQPPSVNSLRVTFSKGGLRKGRAPESGLDRGKRAKRKVSLSEYAPGFVMNGGYGGRRAGYVVEPQRPIVQGRSRSGEVQEMSSQIRSKAVLPCLSFAEVVAQPRAKLESIVESDFHVGPPVSQTGNKDGFPAVCFSAEAFQAGVAKFRFAMVVKFHCSRPPMKSLKHLISAKWGVQGRYSFSEFWDSLHVIIVLESEADVQKGLRCKVRKVGSREFKLFRWSPDYDPLKSLSSNRQWIILPGVPLFLFDKAFAKVIVSSFAELIRVDADSELYRNLSRMRLCVVPREGVMIPEKVWVQLPGGHSYWQYIEVEDPQNQFKEDERKAKYVAECHKEVGNSGESQKKPEYVAEGYKEGEISGRDQWHKAPIQATPNGVQIELHNERPGEVANQWHLVSHSKKKKVVNSLKDPGDAMRDDGIALPNQVSHIACHGDNSVGCVVSIDGQVIVTDEGSISRPLADNRTSNLFIDDRVSFDSSHKTGCGVPKAAKKRGGAHASSIVFVKHQGSNLPNGVYPAEHACDLGKCACLESSSSHEKQGQSQIRLAMAKVPSGNEKPIGSFEELVGQEREGAGPTHIIQTEPPSKICFDVMSKEASITSSQSKESCHILGNDEKDLFDEFDKVKSLMNGDGVGSIYFTHVEGTCDKLVGSKPITHVEGSIEKVMGSTSQNPTNHVNASLSFVGSTSNEAKGSMARKKCGPLRLRGLHSSIPSIHSNVAVLNKGARLDPATPVCSNSATQAGPCDSLELVRKKMGRHKLTYEKEALEPNKDMKEGSNRPAEKDSTSGDSDGSIDLSRILKQPRRKSKGSRKKKGSNVVY